MSSTASHDETSASAAAQTAKERRERLRAGRPRQPGVLRSLFSDSQNILILGVGSLLTLYFAITTQSDRDRGILALVSGLLVGLWAFDAGVAPRIVDALGRLFGRRD